MTEIIMVEETVLLKIETSKGNCISDVDVEIHRGSSEFDNNNCMYTINFDRSRGGKTYLFKKVIKSNDPKDFNEVKIVSGKQAISSNYNKIKSLPFEYIQDSVKVYKMVL